MYRILSVGLLCSLLTITACTGPNKTRDGAVVGAGTGAVAGGAIGKIFGNATRGAIIGAAVGGVAGGVIGRQMDQQAEELENDLEGAEVERVGEGIAVKFESGLLFNVDSSELLPVAQQNLNELAASLGEYDNTEILIVGHTDATGTDSYNQDLSERRARSAAQYLQLQGVSVSRIQTMGRGETDPIADNETASGRQLNRRVELAITATEAFRNEAAGR
ncbi:MAG: OmpA family protein [Bacteroidota bacterium]